MQDGEVVAAIVAGDPQGFAEAYDRYAAPLHTYCSFMLPTPDDAADAVRDTFLIASSRLERLRDPGRLRPWLHAVARNECLRRLSTADVTPPPQKTPGDGALPLAALPASLRGEVLRACADNTPAGRADRASVAHHAGTFGPAGFPKAIGSPAPHWWRRLRRHPRAAAALGTVATVAVAGGLLAMLTIGGPHRAQASTAVNGGGLAGGSPGAPGASGSPGASSSGRPQASPAPGQPTPSVTALGGITSPASPASQGTTPTSSASPSGTSASPSPSPSASPSPSVSPSIVPGVLAATPDELVLTSTSGKAASGKFLLSAVDGPVSHYVIRIPPGMAGKMTVTPAEGNLGAGGSVTVTVTVTSKVALDTRLTIDPGNLTVTILLSLKA
jgi:hypothetical protein